MNRNSVNKLNKGNMKNKFNTLSLLAGVLVLGLYAIPATALPITGESELGSFTTPGANPVFVDWTVAAVGANYQYSYEVENPTTPVGPNHFTVQFDTSTLVGVPTFAAGTIVAGGEGYAPGGLPFFVATFSATSVTWDFSHLAAGQETAFIMTFISTLPPVLGVAHADDTTPPSPWSSLAVGGQLVPVPGVPDGGLTMSLLGFALVGVEGLRRKLRK